MLTVGSHAVGMEEEGSMVRLDALLVEELGLPARSPWPSAQECRLALLALACRMGFEPPGPDETVETSIALRDWVYDVDRDTMFVVRRPLLTALLYVELSSKVTSLGRRFCHICPGYGRASFPIRLPARSWQCSSSMIKAAFKAAVADWWGFRGRTPLGGPIAWRSPS